MITVRLLLPLFLLLTEFVVKTIAYAAWLPCYVEFADDEVVMNHRIATADTAETVVHLRVRPQGTDEWTLASEEEFPVRAGTVYEVQFDIADLRARRPESDEFQFVLEASSGGSFSPDPSAHCENSRAHGSEQGIVKFTMDGTSENVSLVGAWALGHGQVSLTPAAKLRVQSTATQDL